MSQELILVARGCAFYLHHEMITSSIPSHDPRTEYRQETDKKKITGLEDSFHIEYFTIF